MPRSVRSPSRATGGVADGAAPCSWWPRESRCAEPGCSPRCGRIGCRCSTARRAAARPAARAARLSSNSWMPEAEALSAAASASASSDTGRIPEWLAAAAFRQQSQLVQHLRHIRLPDLLRHDADGAERARLAEVQLTLLRGVHHDRDGRGDRIVLDGLDGLQAVHAGHLVIHEDHVRTMVGQEFDGGLGALDRLDLDGMLHEDAGEKKARRLGVVDDQGALCPHACSLPRNSRWRRV